VLTSEPVKYCTRCLRSGKEVPVTGRWKMCCNCRKIHRDQAAKPQRKALIRKWQQDNPEKMRKARLEYYYRNAEELCKNNRDDWWANPKESRRKQNERRQRRLAMLQTVSVNKEDV
jgi:hypothetical protein